VLKALTNAPTGAVVAAATTSLPETLGGPRNWDHRYSWIRDSQFTVRSLGELGCTSEADGFCRFIERSAAGGAGSLQILYGPGGERRLTEVELTHLEGYRGSAPVRVGNAASGQLQLDVYGELLELAWRWHQLGSSPRAHLHRTALRRAFPAGPRALRAHYRPSHPRPPGRSWFLSLAGLTEDPPHPHADVHASVLPTEWDTHEKPGLQSHDMPPCRRQ